MHRHLIVLLIGSLMCGCGDDDEAVRDGSVAGRDGDGGARNADAARAPDAAERRALFSEAVAEYDRQIRATCACYVAAGAYDSEEDCFELNGSGPTWVDCATKTLDGHDTEQLHEDARCMIEQSKARADCLEAAACDELSSCDQVAIECPARDASLVNLILKACPDTGILSRLDRDE